MFKVSVATLKASNGTTFLVCLDKCSRPKDAKPWDTGRITPFETNIKKHADMEAQTWAEFLGCEVTE